MVALKFGLGSAVPDGTIAAWGARFIFPDDILWDRQDTIGEGTPEEETLVQWLFPTALAYARKNIRKLADSYRLLQNGEEDVILYEDATGIIVGNPRRSFGYLYVCAYLK